MVKFALFASDLLVLLFLNWLKSKKSYHVYLDTETKQFF